MYTPYIYIYIYTYIHVFVYVSFRRAVGQRLPGVDREDPVRAVPEARVAAKV